MAVLKKALKVLNDALPIPLDRDLNGAVSLQYTGFGEDGVTASTGTVVLECSNDDKTYFPLKITKNDKTDVDTLAAAGIGNAEVAAYEFARVRMSVAGGAQGVVVVAGHRPG